MKLPAWWPRGLGWLLAIVTVAVVMCNQQDVGLARDEIVYMDNGIRYGEFWSGVALRLDGLDGVTKTDGTLSKDRITKTFGGKAATDNNREHPPLMKTLIGLSHRILYRGLGVDEITALRFPSALMHGLLVLLVFGMVRRLWGVPEAAVSALLVMVLPRALFHASVACFDGPIMTLWFASVYAYWRCLDGRAWPWQAGVVFGLALATKHNALLLPFALALHYMIAGGRAQGLAGIVLFRWRVIVSMIVLAPLTLFVVWPWLWLDPFGNLKDWLVFHLDHVHYNFEYLGDNWNAPRFPWHVALVTTLFTVPVATLAASVIGGGAWFARRREVPDPERMPGLLLALSALASIAPFFLGTTPIFGAEKHWMPVLPSLCIFAGVGTVWAARRLAVLVPPGGVVNLRIRQSVLAAVCAVVVLAGAVETVTAQPYALTWYNALAGGAPGGADRGMNRQFWGVAARGVVEVIARDAPPLPRTKPRTVYSHDASPAWGWYRLGAPWWMPDAGHEAAGIARSDYAIVIHERHFNRHDYLIWKAYGTVQPIFVLRADGVPIVSVYRKPIPAEKPPSP
jgi:hypothetical protein